jgi:hypothetical protein
MQILDHPDLEPHYWELLPEADKAGYSQLRRDLSNGPTRRARNTQLETFDGILEAVRQFAERADENDWRRFLVCGICWMENGIAINIRQLRLLVSKCKSSINGSLQKMGYTTSASHGESWKVLFPHIPILKDSFNELRQWTIRHKSDPRPERRRAWPPPPPAEAKEGDVPAVPEPKKMPAWPLKFRAKMAKMAAAV